MKKVNTEQHGGEGKSETGGETTSACGTCQIEAIYGFHAWLILPSYLCLFLLQASLDQSKISTKQKTKKPSVTHHMVCGNNNSLCREMSAQVKQVE